MEITNIKVTDINEGEYKERNYLWRYNNNSKYLVSHQTTIWEKDFLYSTLKRNDTPWCHELAGTERLKKRNIPIYTYRGETPLEYDETIVCGQVRDNCEKYFEIDLEDN